MKRLTPHEKFEFVFKVHVNNTRKIERLLIENKYKFIANPTPFKSFIEYVVEVNIRKSCCLWNLIVNLIYV